MKKIVILPFLLIFMFGCLTTGSHIDNRPDWLENYPAEDGYYIGIGSANTGDEVYDREIAEARALTGIASAISTNIRSELTIEGSEDSAGNNREVVNEKITAEVEQSLSGYEIVDVFYSKESGAWVYMKLSKALWAKIQKEEMAKLIARIDEFLVPSLNDYERPVTSKIHDLVKAKQLILDSPYAGMLKTSMLGESGILIDIIDTKLKDCIDSVVFRLNPSSIEMEIGKSAEVTINVTSDISSSVGNFPFKIVNEENESLIRAFTDSDGSFETEIKSSKLAMGQNYISLVLDRDEFKMNESYDSLSFPEKKIIAEIKTLSIGLEALVTHPTTTTIAGLNGSIRSLFSANTMPFKFGSSDDTYLKFELVLSDFPKLNEKAPSMAKAYAIISLIKNERAIYSYESNAVKDGGINFPQAHERATAKLIRTLGSTDDYIVGITEVLAVN